MRSKLYLLIVLVITAAFFADCTKDEPTPTPPATKKYYISKVYKNGNLAEEFTYNAANKLIKWQASDSSGALVCDFAYNTSNVLTDLVLYVNSMPFGNVLVEMNANNAPSKVVQISVVDTTTITFDYTGGILTKLNYYFGSQVSSVQNYGYLALTNDANGNVTREVFNDIPASVRYQYDYEYDNKNSPLYYDNIKWPYFLLLNYMSGENVCNFLSKHNVIKNTMTIPTPVEVTNSSYLYNTDGYPTQLNDGTDVYTMEYIVK